MEMNTLLFTAFDAAYLPLATITVPRMGDYAKRHGYQFHCYTEPIFDIPNAMYWSGVLGAAPNLETFDRVMYLDVDQLITNPDITFDHLPASGFHVSRDWGKDATTDHQFSMCGWLAHKDCIPLFHRAFEMEPAWRDKPFPEQAPMQYLAIEAAKLFRFYPRRTFNAVPDAVSPGNVPEPWQPGDFAAHLTMLPMDDRVKLAKEIYEKAK